MTNPNTLDDIVRRALDASTVAERWAAASEIASQGRPGLLAARRLLADDAEDSRVLGAEILGRVPVLDEHAVSVAVGELTTALSDSRHGVKAAVALNLARLPSVELVSKLMALRYDTRRGVRLAFAIAVQTDSDGAVDALLELAVDSDAEVRSWAVFRLTEPGEIPERVLDVLVRCAVDEVASIRHEAVAALASCGDPRAREFILRDLADDAVGEWIADAALDMPSEVFIPLLEERLSRVASGSPQQEQYQAAIEAARSSRGGEA